MRTISCFLSVVVLCVASCAVAPRSGTAPAAPDAPVVGASPAGSAPVQPVSTRLPDQTGVRRAADLGAAEAEAIWDRLPTWLVAWTRSGRPPAGLATGIALARERRVALLALMRYDPRAALARRLNWTQRAGLPPEVLALVEEPVVSAARLMAKAARRDGEGVVVVPVLSFA